MCLKGKAGDLGQLVSARGSENRGGELGRTRARRKERDGSDTRARASRERRAACGGDGLTGGPAWRRERSGRGCGPEGREEADMRASLVSGKASTRASGSAGLLRFASWAAGLGKRGRGKGLGLGVELA